MGQRLLIKRTPNILLQFIFTPIMDKVKSMVDSGLGYVKAETSNIYELSGCVCLAFLAHSQAIGGFNYAIIFAVLYALYGSQFNHRFRGNPAFTFADWLKDGELSCFDVFKQVIFQIGGYALGFLLGGLIGLTPHTPTAASDTSFHYDAIRRGAQRWRYGVALASRARFRSKRLVERLYGICHGRRDLDGLQA